MRRIILSIVATAACLGVSAQPPMHHGGQRGGMTSSKDSDSTLQALIKTVVPQFRQLTYTDPLTGQTLEYNLFTPADFDGSQSYPLVLFMADASTVGKEVTAPLTQGYGALLFASDADQAKHPCFVLSPEYTEWTVSTGEVKSPQVDMTLRLLRQIIKDYNVDPDRVYTTGQSMGGMMSFYFNLVAPDLFAASLFVGSQWDTSILQSFAYKKFFYITGGGDMQATGGVRGLINILNEENAQYEYGMWSAKLPQSTQDENAKSIISIRSPRNFIVFNRGTVLPEDGRGMEHMESFDYAYRLTPVRDWLLGQVREQLPSPAPYQGADSVAALLHNVANGQVLVSAYGGDAHGQGVTPNSPEAIRKAIDKGAAIAAIVGDDLQADSLDAIFQAADGRIALMFCTPQGYIDAIRKAAKKAVAHGTVMLGNTLSDSEFMCIPSVEISDSASLTLLSETLSANPTAIELRFASINDTVRKAFDMCKGKCRIAVNTTAAQTVAGHSDDNSFRLGADTTWGELIDMGATIITTAQIKPLLKWLKTE